MRNARRTFRHHALDGAALYFQPATGVHVRVTNEATAPLRRHAPRVAMFGITNACNLACTFCSRSLARPSLWTVATAAAVLRGLHDASTLEVAYGGGEPFAFRGFAELVAELDESTTLAQHVTTNGTLIRPAMWAPYAGRFGQVRISIYEGIDWQLAATTLADHGQRWGVNLLVDASVLDTLPAQLAELTVRGCHDVSLLSYVGPERERHLDRAGDARLAEIIADSPIACRLSVCFGDRVHVARLFDNGDCGAGRDFISITPDQRVQSCSFQDRSLPGATVEEILDAWRLQQPLLAAPSPRAGCARALPMAGVTTVPPFAVWRAFSGNNSGECVLVAKFHEVAETEAFLAELLPTWNVDGDYSPEWRALFVAEGLLNDVDKRFYDDPSPRELVQLGRSVIAMQYAADDAFPELRALAWKRGAVVAPGGIHVHDGLALLVGIKTTSDADRDRLLASTRPGSHAGREAELSRSARVYVHGDLVLLLQPIARHLTTLAEARDAILEIADGRALAAELLFEDADDAAIIRAKQHLGHRPVQVRRLWVNFSGPDGVTNAAAFAHMLAGERTTVAGAAVLIDPAPDRKRLAVLAFRRGGDVNSLDDERVAIRASIWTDEPRTRGAKTKPRVYDRDAIEATVRTALPRDGELAITWPDAPQSYRPGPSFVLETREPARVMRVLAGLARSLDEQLSIVASDPDPVGATLRRVVEDLGR